MSNIEHLMEIRFEDSSMYIKDYKKIKYFNNESNKIAEMNNYNLK